MIFYDEYDAPPSEVDELLRDCEMGRLVTTGADGSLHIGLYPFLASELAPPEQPRAIELHLNKADEQVADLAFNARCLFEVDEVLAVVPSYWLHPDNAVFATAYYRSLILDCTATVSADLDLLAQQQARLIRRYQPEGGYRPLSATDPMYRGMLGKLRALTLRIERCRTKFKLGQNRSREQRLRVVEHLRARGRPSDARAADALYATLGQPTSE
jgi:predicted FMN-binding regulatory protein PaiB